MEGSTATTAKDCPIAFVSQLVRQTCFIASMNHELNPVHIRVYKQLASTFLQAIIVGGFAACNFGRKAGYEDVDMYVGVDKTEDLLIAISKMTDIVNIEASIVTFNCLSHVNQSI